VWTKDSKARRAAVVSASEHLRRQREPAPRSRPGVVRGREEGGVVRGREELGGVPPS
jgi:hypothetical protein